MTKFLIRIFDLLIAALLVLSLSGGIEWGGKTVLRHAADPRRAVILLLAAGFFGSRLLREKSLFLRWAAALIQRLSGSTRLRWDLLGLGCLLASLISVLQALALRVRLYDVGIFHQILWSLTEGLGFHSTISGAGNFLLDHSSLSLVIFAPFFWLSGASPLLLPLLQPLLLFGGASAWVWLAERLPECSVETRGRIAAYTVLVVLGFQSLWANIEWGFHENALAFFALSWAFAWMYLWRSAWVIALFLVVAAASKEILLVSVAFVFFFWAVLAWREKERSWISPLLRCGVGLLLIALFVWFEKLPHPADKNYFVRYYAYLGSGIGDFLKTLLLNPFAVVQNVGAGELFKYLKTVLFPWLGLPLAILVVPGIRIWGGLLLGILPSFVSAAIATYPPLRGTGFHYVLELWPALAVVTLVVVSRFEGDRLQRVLQLWLLVGLLGLDFDPLSSLREYASAATQQRDARMEMVRIPVAQTVAADELAGPWVAGRKTVTRWPDLRPFEGGCPDWLVVGRGREAEVLELKCASGEKPVLQWAHGDWAGYRLLKPSS